MNDVVAKHIVWSKGGEATIVMASGDAIVLQSSVPSPPGSRIEGTLQGEPKASIKVKIHGSKRMPDGTFRLEGRPLDLTREVRERVVAMSISKS